MRRLDTAPSRLVLPVDLHQLHSCMPIDIGEFRSASEEELQAGGLTNGERILGFLAANSDQAFTPSEIHVATGIARGSVGVVLSRLEESELVDHRGEYWAVAPEADAAKTLTGASVARAVTDRFGPEDPEEWGHEGDCDGDNRGRGPRGSGGS